MKRSRKTNTEFPAPGSGTSLPVPGAADTHCIQKSVPITSLPQHVPEYLGHSSHCTSRGAGAWESAQGARGEQAAAGPGLSACARHSGQLRGSWGCNPFPALFIPCGCCSGWFGLSHETEFQSEAPFHYLGSVQVIRRTVNAVVGTQCNILNGVAKNKKNLNVGMISL